MRVRRVYVIVLIMLLTAVMPHSLSAQVNPQIDTARNEGPQVRGLEYHKEEPDSVKRGKVYYFFYTPAQTKIDAVLHPSLSPTGAQFNDPMDAINGNYYLGVGVAGHSHLTLYPTPEAQLAASLIGEPFPAYAKRLGNVRFYQTRMPFSQLAYHSSLDKDYVVRATHTQNIMPGWNVSFDYTLMRPEGIYTATYAKDHFLDLWK